MRFIYLVAGIFLGAFTVQAVAANGHITVADAKLYYQLMGKGEPIIFLHGGPGLDQSYLVPSLRKMAENHEVVFYDQRGSGLSIPQELNPSLMTPAQFVKDLEVVRKHFGYQKVILVGHSWGSLLAMMYAIEYPQHIKALVLMNSVPVDMDGFQAFMQEYQNRMQPIQGKLTEIENSAEFKQGEQSAINHYLQLVFSKYLYKDTDIDKLTLNFSSTTTKNFSQISFLMFSEYDIKSLLDKLNIPTLMIHGNNDIVPLWTAEQTAKIIPGAQLAVIKMSGHFSFAEQPDEVLLVMNRFLDSLK